MYLITTRRHGLCRKFAIERVKVLRCVCLSWRKGEISVFGLGRMRSPRRSIEHGSRDAAAADVYRHRARVRGLLLLVSAWPLSGPFDCWCSTCVYFSTSVLIYSQAPYRKKGYFLNFLVIFVVEVLPPSTVVHKKRDFRTRLDLPSNRRTHPPHTFKRIFSWCRFYSSLPSYFPFDMATTSGAWMTSSNGQSECYRFFYIFLQKL